MECDSAAIIHFGAETAALLSLGFILVATQPLIITTFTSDCGTSDCGWAVTRNAASNVTRPEPMLVSRIVSSIRSKFEAVFAPRFTAY